MSLEHPTSKNKEKTTIHEDIAKKDDKHQKEGSLSNLENEKKMLEEQLGSFKKTNEETNNALARTRADFHNYKARVDREKEKERALAAERAVSFLIPVYDNLERTLESIEEDDTALFKGISMVNRQFLSALTELGLEKISTEGIFNPAIHEAIGVIEVDKDEDDGKILDVLQHGYSLGGKVIRASKVRVGKTKEKNKA